MQYKGFYIGIIYNKNLSLGYSFKKMNSEITGRSLYLNLKHCQMYLNYGRILDTPAYLLLIRREKRLAKNIKRLVEKYRQDEIII